jgi:hypothetical protein
MGTVPIPGFSPLTLTRSDEPTLELPLPISRVDAESSNTGGHADEGYSPRTQAPPELCTPPSLRIPPTRSTSSPELDSQS